MDGILWDENPSKTLQNAIMSGLKCGDRVKIYYSQDAVVLSTDHPTTYQVAVLDPTKELKQHKRWKVETVHPSNCILHVKETRKFILADASIKEYVVLEHIETVFWWIAQKGPSSYPGSDCSWKICQAVVLDCVKLPEEKKEDPPKENATMSGYKKEPVALLGLVLPNAPVPYNMSIETKPGHSVVLREHCGCTGVVLAVCPNRDRIVASKFGGNDWQIRVFTKHNIAYTSTPYSDEKYRVGSYVSKTNGSKTGYILGVQRSSVTGMVDHYDVAVSSSALGFVVDQWFEDCIEKKEDPPKEKEEKEDPPKEEETLTKKEFEPPKIEDVVTLEGCIEEETKIGHEDPVVFFDGKTRVKVYKARVEVDEVINIPDVPVDLMGRVFHDDQGSAVEFSSNHVSFTKTYFASANKSKE